jgi:membrane fusion protein (multidrug efflux system)
MKRRRVVIFIALVLLIIVIGGFAYFQFVVKPQMIQGFIAANKQPPVTVTAEPAKVESWTPKVPAIGTLVAAEGIDVASQVAGTVVSIHFQSGEDVAAGALLVKLDDSVEQADLKSGQAQLTNANLQLERMAALLKRRTASQADYDSALAQRDIAAAAVEHTQALIAHKAITAPFAGRLGIREVDIGDYVTAGKALVNLQQLDPIYVDFPVPEQDFRRLLIGQTVEAAADAYPGETFTGQIKSIDARVNQDTRSVLVRTELENPDHRLLPGMFANVNVLAGAPQRVVTVPRTAVTYSLYGDSVYVVQSANAAESGAQAAEGSASVAERRFVRVGDTRGDRVSITEGVKEGEEVVTSGQIKLQPNAHITVDNSAPLKAPAERPRE